jgi:hypothetical protein
MVVIIGLRKLTNGGIQVGITRPRQGSSVAQTYDSEEDARAVLRRMGVGENAIDYYLFTLLPWLSGGEQLMFPPMDIPLSRLSSLGFKVGRTPLVREP